MSGIDWSNAPEGTMGHALIGQSFRPVWVGNDWYEYIEGARHRFASDPDTFYAYARSGLHDYAENPSAQAWTGAGLPPIGARIECDIHNGRFIPCKVAAHVPHKGEFAAVVVYDGIDAWDWATAGECFRPIRTPEQIEAEERADAIEKMWSIYWQPHATSAKQALGLLWDAGLRFADESDRG